ncbi:MAG: zinc ribbon domain-containing protein [Nitrospirota bacterium]|jgi:putative FmdB family regulatory protein
MPQYDYECKKCGKRFTLIRSVKEHEAKKRVRCPECKSQSVRPVYAGFTAITSKKS